MTDREEPRVLLLLVEAVFVALIVAGVAVVFWPAALILAGCAGVWACERESARRSDTRRAGSAR